MRPVREITAAEENFRTVPLVDGPGFRAVTTKRDPVEPEPVGSYVVMVFKVTGYDPDCDGSLMARLAHVDRDGYTTGWEPTHLGLHSDTDLIVDDPAELWNLANLRRTGFVICEQHGLMAQGRCQITDCAAPFEVLYGVATGGSNGTS